MRGISVLWPFTEISAIRVERTFAGFMLRLTRKRRGKEAALKVWKIYRRINGREL